MICEAMCGNDSEMKKRGEISEGYQILKGEKEGKCKEDEILVRKKRALEHGGKKIYDKICE